MRTATQWGMLGLVWWLAVCGGGLARAEAFESFTASASCTVTLANAPFPNGDFGLQACECACTKAADMAIERCASKAAYDDRNGRCNLSGGAGSGSATCTVRVTCIDLGPQIPGNAS